MNNYEQKQQEKKERLQARAESYRIKAGKLSKEGWQALYNIPFGQPILIGHHSEKSDRAYRGKAINKIDKSVEESNKAEYYEQKAKRIGMGGISSDDPEVIKKLKTKLKELEDLQEKMRNINKILKSKKFLKSEKIAKLVNDFNITEIAADKLFRPDCFGKIGFASFQLSNNNAKIKNTEKRLKKLLKSNETESAPDIKKDGYIIRQDKKLNRIMFIFEGKPEEVKRKVLKARGFHWSPRNTAWQRMLNANGIYAARQIIKELSQIN